MLRRQRSDRVGIERCSHPARDERLKERKSLSWRDRRRGFTRVGLADDHAVNVVVAVEVDDDVWFVVSAAG